MRREGSGQGQRVIREDLTTISDLCSWTLTLVYVGWCYGGYHGDAVHVETAALDRNRRRACAEIYKGHQFQVKGGECRWRRGKRSGTARRGLVVPVAPWWAVKNELPLRSSSSLCSLCRPHVPRPPSSEITRDKWDRRGRGRRDIGECEVTWRPTLFRAISAKFLCG